MESWVVNNMSLANRNTCWDIGDRCGDGGKVSRAKVTWRVAEDLMSQMICPNKAMDRLNGLPFSESLSPTRTLTIWSPVYCLSHLRSHDLCVSIALIFLSFNLCHSTHIRSYLYSAPICLTHFHSFTYSSLSYLWCAYLIYTAIAIRLDHFTS